MRLKKTVTYLLVSAITFLLGIVVSPIHFSSYSSACGPRSTSSHYTSSYFLDLVSYEVTYESSEEAEVAWREQVSKADSVLEQSPLLDPKGEQIGSRAVIA